MSAGGVVWLTGLPAAGKTTLAQALCARLAQQGLRASAIDGDELRATVSRGLDFGREGRRENARRAAAMAIEQAQGSGWAVVALVSPFRADRQQAREAVAAAGLRFIEVWVDAPVELCRRRDPKGLYAAAAARELVGMTGWDAPYEQPPAPEVRIAPGAGGEMPAVRGALEQVMAVLGNPQPPPIPS